jgi:hypothetical protein
MTFEEIHKLSYKQIFKNNKDIFNPSEFLDMNEEISDEEILSKFKTKKTKINETTKPNKKQPMYYQI